MGYTKDAFFTASLEDNFDKKQSILDNFGDKVLIHSDDIHEFEHLEKDKYRCLTWIKANHTFEGLKQILIEPKERIKIQELNPIYNENKTNVLDSIAIMNNDSWFEDKKLDLNCGLVSIIGEKGAGKTALLDLIAISNDEGIYEKDLKNPYSFYNRAKDVLVGTILDIEYLGGSKSSYELNGQTAKSATEKHAKVRYLSLKELESYCDEKYKFQDFIKDIILETYPDVADFDERTKTISKNIKKHNFSINNLFELTKGSNELIRALENKQIELENHVKNQPKLSINFTQEQEEEFRLLISKEQELNNKLKNNKAEQSEITDFLGWLNNETKSIKQGFLNDINIKNNMYKFLDKELISNLNIEINISNLNVVNDRLQLLKNNEIVITEELTNNSSKIKPLEGLNKGLKDEQTILKQWYESKTKIENEIENLKSQINNIQNNLTEMEKIKVQLKEYYLELIKIKIEQKKKYEDLKSVLEKDNNISFDVKIEFNYEKLYAIEDSIIKHGQGNSQEKIQDILKDKFISILNINESNLDDDFSDICELIDWINGDLFIKDIFGENRSSESLLKKGLNLSDFYNWIYDDYYEVNYFINFKSKPLETLSPGQKGLALMKIFLKLDKSTKPLLIDQPEDNLDNKSVYFDLVDDIKEIKKKRQVIIATHNPNLVVNTDTEQVIVAKFEDNPSNGQPKIQYYAGALEDINIRKEVCDILEGGDTAFRKREERYSLRLGNKH
jgi:ABC-type lipoprotein export system ATPase subunit